ncbi:hypothetical protein Bbelb_256750 [Branchiostoma belcheri]|nr:hypothetical protein Bbelb_256750 [Branchiostoma belcheri]
MQNWAGVNGSILMQGRRRTNKGPRPDDSSATTRCYRTNSPEWKRCERRPFSDRCELGTRQDNIKGRPEGGTVPTGRQILVQNSHPDTIFMGRTSTRTWFMELL